MKPPPFSFLVILVMICLFSALAGLYFLFHFKRIFRKWIRYEWLRQNIVVWLAVFCCFSATAPLSHDFFGILATKGLPHILLTEIIDTTVNVLFVFNSVTIISRSRILQKLSFTKQRIVILLTIVISVGVFNSLLTYITSGYDTEGLKYSILFSTYLGAITGFVYIMMSYRDMERTRKMQEKELELSRISELKTKAELDALHSKVNPHFLYNALNSIADLSITDGRKARKMTIALADLFRYSINYTQNNYSTINDEVAMTEVYLQIEKIRFEDQLNYSVKVEEGTGHYLVPRFILQALVENSVKHGLKVTGRMTEIVLEVKMQEQGLIINIIDNGPPFPDELVPGYGVKSVFDKLDLLFPANYEIHFSNQPRKQGSIHLYKLIKNEPAV
jgi:two-component system LytT family sensor kinase